MTRSYARAWKLVTLDFSGKWEGAGVHLPQENLVFDKGEEMFIKNSTGTLVASSLLLVFGLIEGLIYFGVDPTDDQNRRMFRASLTLLSLLVSVIFLMTSLEYPRNVWLRTFVLVGYIVAWTAVFLCSWISLVSGASWSYWLPVILACMVLLASVQWYHRHLLQKERSGSRLPLGEHAV